MDDFVVSTVRQISYWREMAEQHEEVAQSVEDERPDLAAVFAQFGRAFRILEAASVELLGLYTEKVTGEES
jgi:phage-related tail protein